MSPARALPWALLALSLVAHAWMLRPPGGPASSRPTPSPIALTDQSAQPPAPPALPAPSADSPIGHSSLDIRPSAPPSPPSPTATFAAYADILAEALETTEQHQELARVLARWIALDPVAASEWLDRRPDDPRLDLPVAQVANHLTGTADYTLAREWAESIHTPSVRVDALENVLAEQFRAKKITADALRATATRDGLPPDRVLGILNYSRLD
ncbi:MAG: hypothetical protein H7067_17195 [Burkholderiales bacterium]|nr:hypothetical protein [Opitutaceae bacterium]